MLWRSTSSQAIAVFVWMLLTAGRPATAADCDPDFVVSAPGVWTGDTCGAGDDCSIRPSQEHVYQVSVAESGLWTLSLCGSSFDTHLNVGTTPGGTDVGTDDDSCGIQSEITVNLGAGTYYVTVEGYMQSYCGGYTLSMDLAVCYTPAEPAYPHPSHGTSGVPTDGTVLSWNGFFVPESTAKSGPTVIYGSDDRLDEYQVTNQALRAVGDSTVVLVAASSLSDNGDGTFTLPWRTFTDYVQAVYGAPLCADEPFRDQPTPGKCSGFLIADDIVATAGHCVRDSYGCTTTAFVFGLVMLDSSTPALTVSADDVYYCSEIIDRVETSVTDWGLIRLDRPVTGHSPLAIRATGKVPDSEPLILVGHPFGLPRKYAGGASVRDNTPIDYFEANVDAYGGNSGSAVFNANTLQVEGVLVRGNTDFVNIGGCMESNWCPDTGCPGWEEITRTTVFADQIASYDVYFGACGNVKYASTTNVMYHALGTLSKNTSYCWYVVAKNECGQARGPATGYWTFSTSSAAESDCADGIDNDGDGLTDCYDLTDCGAYDTDGDGICDGEDPCPLDYPDDSDGDGVCDSVDNCVAVSNPEQKDGNQNGIGDVCDTARPVLIGAVSRKTHAGVGNWDIDVGAGDIESRSVQVSTGIANELLIIATFDIPVLLAGGPDDVTTDVGTVGVVPGAASNELDITIRDLPFNAQVNFRFGGVVNYYFPVNECATESTLCVRVVVGDYDNLGHSNFLDFAKVKNAGYLNHVADSLDKARADFDCNGRSNFFDFAKIKVEGLLNHGADACSVPIGP